MSFHFRVQSHSFPVGAGWNVFGRFIECLQPWHSHPLLSVCGGLEAMGVSWCYGTQRFSDDIESMLGFQPGPFWKITWAYVIFILVDYYKIHSMK